MLKRFLSFISFMTILALSVPALANAESMMEFPYKWNTSSSVNTDFRALTTDSDNWGWMSAYNGYWLMTTKNKWVGKVLATKLPVDLPTEGKIGFTFWYSVSDEVTFTLRGYRDGEVIELSKIDVVGTGKSYVYTNMTFDARGPMQLGLEATLTGGNGNCYGSAVIKEINIIQSGADMAAVEMLSPVTTAVAGGIPMSVEVRFENLTTIDVENPKFTYQIGDNAPVEEIYNGTVAGTSVIDYKFTTPYVPAVGERFDIVCGVSVDGDANTDNDRITAENVYAYRPYKFPYRTSFDDYDEIEYWQLIDANGNGYNWEFGAMDDNGTVNRFLGFRASYGTYDDYAVSPAIEVPAGKSRLSFYYVGVSGGTHLTVLMGDTPDVTKMDRVLFDCDVNNNGWRNGYALLDEAETGLKYFAFHITGGQDQLLIDNVSVDSAEDLCIESVSSDISKGYNLDKTVVTLSFSNHGISPQSGIKLRYGMNDLETYVEETFGGTVNPGETVSHTFTVPADVSVPEQDYQLYGMIATAVGDDTYNDSMRGDRIHHFANRTIPYFNDFSGDDVTDRWTFASPEAKSKWSITTSVEAYSPVLGYDENYLPMRAKVLRHANKISQLDKSDNWAFSECVEMVAGEYDFSFFYRTSRDWNRDDFRQSVEVKFGNAPDAACMTIDAVELSDFLVAGVTYQKYVGHVTIPEDGLYFMGFRNVSNCGDGETYIDNIAIDNRANAKSLPYETDFAVNAGEWERYYPSGEFTQWVVDGHDMHLFRNNDDSQIGNLTHAEGILASPKLSVDGVDKLRVSFDYGFSTNEPATRLQLLASSVNHPDSYKVIAEYEASDVMKNVVAEFVPDAPEGELWIGFKTNHQISENDQFEGNGYDLRVADVIVGTPSQGALSDLADESMLVVSDGSVVAPDGMILDLYDVTGCHIASGNRIDTSSLRGVYIVRVIKDGTVVYNRKLMI